MKNRTAPFLLVLLTCAGMLPAQSPPVAQSSPQIGLHAVNAGVQSAPANTPPPPSFAPFARFAFGVGISPMGVNMQAVTSLNRHMNARITGNLLKLNINDIDSDGFNVDAKIDLASAGASLDVYPFPKHGLRFSPGILFYNSNAASGTFVAKPGTSFTLNDYDYYSSNSDPVKGFGNLNLHKQSPAFTMTAGWGNMIPRNGGHFSFPFEVGVAFIGAPDVALKLTSGQACDGNGLNCVYVATDPDVQANLAAQVTKYKSNVEQLKTYPIVSFGMAYSFGFGPRAVQTK